MVELAQFRQEMARVENDPEALRKRVKEHILEEVVRAERTVDRVGRCQRAV